MNRKIKYLFFLVSFITVNTVILIVAVVGSILLSELVLGKIHAFSDKRSLVSVGGLVLGAVISVLLYLKLYSYFEKKWYIHRIFDFHHKKH